MPRLSRRRLGQAALARAQRWVATLDEIRPEDAAAAAFAGFGSATTLAGGRRLLLNPGSIRLDEDVTVLPGAAFEALDPTRVVLSIGRGCYLGFSTRIVALNGVHLEAGVVLGHNITLTDTIHDYKNAGPDVSPGAAPLKIGRPLLVGARCWIGNNSVIAGGITLGERAIIGANSSVTRDVPARTMVLGNPARIVREMSPDGTWRWLVDPAEVELGPGPG